MLPHSESNTSVGPHTPTKIVVGADGATYEKFADGTSKDISDELPFDLPQGWAWARLSDLTDSRILNDGDWIVSSDMSENGNVKLLQLGSVGNGVYENKGFKCITEAKFCELGCTEIHQGYLLINRMIGDTLLACILPPIEGKVITAVDVCWVAPSERYDVKWLLFLVLSQWFQKKAKSLGAGEGRIRISKGNLVKIVFPMPPLTEQERIVAKVEELFAYAATIDEATDDIAKTAERIDKKILDLAIRGQLVPQDPNDEPASELVKRIEAVKKSKSGGKNLRAAASDRPAYEIDPPFDIPDSWEWVRLGEVLLPMTTKHPTGETFKYIDIEAIDNKTNVVLSPKHLPVEKAPSRACRGLQTGDTLFSIVRPYLRNIAYIADSLSDCIASTGFYVCRPSEAIEPMFLFKLLLSNYVVNGLNAFMKGDNSPSIRVEQLHDYPVPLPPLAEQKRIVSKIEELQTMTKSLTM